MNHLQVFNPQGTMQWIAKMTCLLTGSMRLTCFSLSTSDVCDEDAGFFFSLLTVLKLGKIWVEIPLLIVKDGKTHMYIYIYM